MKRQSDNVFVIEDEEEENEEEQEDEEEPAKKTKRKRGSAQTKGPTAIMTRMATPPLMVTFAGEDSGTRNYGFAVIRYEGLARRESTDPEFRPKTLEEVLSGHRVVFSFLLWDLVDLKRGTYRSLFPPPGTQQPPPAPGTRDWSIPGGKQCEVANDVDGWSDNLRSYLKTRSVLFERDRTPEAFLPALVMETQAGCMHMDRGGGGFARSTDCLVVTNVAESFVLGYDAGRSDIYDVGQPPRAAFRIMAKLGVTHGDSSRRDSHDDNKRQADVAVRALCEESGMDRELRFLDNLCKAKPKPKETHHLADAVCGALKKAVKLHLDYDSEFRRR